MSKPKHTPGPWRATRDVDWIERVVERDGILLAQVYNSANAQLIAAAPELLEGFANMLLFIETYGGEVTSNFAGHNNENLDWYKSVLARARGES